MRLKCFLYVFIRITQSDGCYGHAWVSSVLSSWQSCIQEKTPRGDGVGGVGEK